MSKISSANLYTESGSNIAWGAIIAGAIVAITVSLLLLILGSGLGFSLSAPWYNASSVAKTLTLETAIWLIVMQWISSASGGYLTGRLTNKTNPADDSFFQAAVHGFITWSIATLITVTILSSTMLSIISNSASTISDMTAKAAQGQGTTKNLTSEPLAYYTDILLRSNNPSTNASLENLREETLRILINTIKNNEISEQDKTYLAEVISNRTDVSAEEASKQIDDVIEQIKKAEEKTREAADSARKVSAYISIYTFLSMLIGMFIASIAAGFGVYHRQENRR